MRFKPGVQIAGASSELILGLCVADSVHRERCGAEITITSVSDGTHKPNSLHYKGRAADLRTRDLAPSDRALFANVLRDALGAEWDVVVEDDHVHMEWDPK